MVLNQFFNFNNMKQQFDIEGGNFRKAGSISSSIKKTLMQLNVDSKIIRKTVVALYEAEVNVVAHAYEGIVDVEISSSNIKITITDKGPGIPDINKAMEKGFSTASPEVREMGFGAGMGLPNIKNNTDEFELSSQKDIGTVLTFKVYF